MTLALEERIGRLETRMSRAERALGFLPDPAPARLVVPPPAPVLSPPMPMAPLKVEPIADVPVTAEPPATIAPAKSADWMELAVTMKQQSRGPAKPPAPPSVPVRDVTPIVEAVDAPSVDDAEPVETSPVTYWQPSAPEPVKQTTFERTVGLKWAGWAGAIVMVIGVALGIKFAYEQGFFSTIPPTLRLMLMYLGGFGLIAAGEVVYRRVNKLSAVGLFGAGVASLFVISYAGHGYYDLYTRDAAFGLMALATLIGAAVAMRGGMVSIAALSIIGGNVAPLVLSSGHPPSTSFFAYLVALQGVALILAAWGREAKWWTLRGLSLSTTGLWMFVSIGRGYGTPTMLLTFSIVMAALYHAELLLTNWRWSKRETADDATRIGGGESTAIGLVFSVIVTAALALGGLYVLRNESDLTRAAWLASIGAAALVLRALTARTTGGLQQLSIGYTVQAAALATAAMPVALGGMALSFGWAILAVTFAALAAVTRSRVARIAAPAVWAFAVAYLLAWTQDQSDLATRVVLGQTVTDVSLVAAGLALIGYVVARVLLVRLADDEVEPFTKIAQGLAGIATLTFVVAAVASLPGLVATLMLVAFAWFLVLIDRPLRPLQLAVHGLALLAIATVKWATVDVLAGFGPANAAAAYEPIVNPLMGTGLVVAASLAVVAWWRRATFVEALSKWGATDAAERLLQVTAGVIVGLVTLGLSVEIHRAIELAVAKGTLFARPPEQLKLLGLTMLWTAAVVVYRAILTIAARAQRREIAAMPMLTAAIALLVGKYVVIDTLMFHLNGRAGRVGGLVNAELFAALLLIGGALVVRWLSPKTLARAAARALYAAVAIAIVWAGTMQIDAYVATNGGAPWGAFRMRHILWTAWWSLCTAGFGWPAIRRNGDDLRVVERSLSIMYQIGMALAAQFLLLNLIVFGVIARTPSVAVVFNLQGLAVTSVLALLGSVAIRTSRADLRDRSQRSRLASMLMIVAMLLVWGTVEIGRFFAGPGAAVFASPARAKGVAISIYWAAFAIGAVTAGFQWRTAALRYVGLGLFAVTLAKVFFVDLGEIGTGYRILSFFGLGLLLMGTSVLYGKLGPKLLAEERTEAKR